MESIFADFDLDESGSVDKTELSIVTRMLASQFEEKGLKNPTITYEMIDAAFNEMDTNNDGGLTRQEMAPFIKLLIAYLVENNYDDLQG